jgi:hypothetical protein
MDLERGGPLRNEQVDRNTRQFGCQLRHAFDRIIRIAVFDHQVAALKISEISQAGAERVQIRRQARRPLRGDPADAVEFR